MKTYKVHSSLFDQRGTGKDRAVRFLESGKVDRENTLIWTPRKITAITPAKLANAKTVFEDWLDDAMTNTGESRNIHIDQLGLKDVSVRATIAAGLEIFEHARTLVPVQNYLLFYLLDLTDGRKPMIGRPDALARLSQKLCCPPLIYLVKRKNFTQNYVWQNFKRIHAPKELSASKDSKLYYAEQRQPGGGYRRGIYLVDARLPLPNVGT